MLFYFAACVIVLNCHENHRNFCILKVAKFWAVGIMTTIQKLVNQTRLSFMRRLGLSKVTAGLVI